MNITFVHDKNLELNYKLHTYSILRLFSFVNLTGFENL